MLQVVVFEGVQNLPLFAAEANGEFARRGLEIHLQFTPNSWTLRNGLADGRFKVAHTAVDNAIAMVELAGKEVSVVMGGDSGFNALFLQPGVPSVEALRGRTVLVDAPNTAFALVLYRILALHGLQRGDYEVKSVGATPLRLAAMQEDRTSAAAILNLPFRIHAERAGLHFAGEATDFIGPYLSTSAFVLSAWARENEEVLVRYLQGYIAGLRWALDPAHRAAAIALLVQRLKLERDIAERAFNLGTAAGGFATDAALDMAGLENVLRLRAQVEGQWNGVAPPAQRYVELSYHRKALEGL